MGSAGATESGGSGIALRCYGLGSTVDPTCEVDSATKTSQVIPVCIMVSSRGALAIF